MSWCALDIRAAETTRPQIAEWLVRRTGQAVEERADGSLVGVTAAPTVDAVIAELRAAFQDVSAVARSLPVEDWTSRWREGLSPRRIGRLTISPSWVAPREDDRLLVVIDPETAFGTGEHGSTRSVLQLLDRWVRPGQRVLDLGSGSGILSIAAIKLGAGRAVGIDIDPEAEAVARENAARNGTGSRKRISDRRRRVACAPSGRCRSGPLQHPPAPEPGLVPGHPGCAAGRWAGVVRRDGNV